MSGLPALGWPFFEHFVTGLSPAGPETVGRFVELPAATVAERRADALIAQLCLDHQAWLITRDRDFRAFAAAAGLDLMAG